MMLGMGLRIKIKVIIIHTNASIGELAAKISSCKIYYREIL